jgi:very-short-patch-repair endonuclease
MGARRKPRKPRSDAHTPLLPGGRAHLAWVNQANGARVVRVVGACTVSLAPELGRDEVIAALAEAQRGRVARWQLVAGGLGRDAIDRCIRRGQLVAEYDGIYALPAARDIPLGPDSAAVLAGGPGTRLSHHSASMLWVMRRGVADPVHITIPYGRRGPQTEHLVTHRTRLQHPDDVRIHRGLPVTSPARTLLDNAAQLPDRELEQMLDEAMFIRRVLTRLDLSAALERSAGHPGRARLARVSGEVNGPRRRADSRHEERLQQMILAAGLPEPQTQAHVLGYKLDLYWPAQRLAVEVDTYGTHGSPRRFAADRRKDARLLSELGIVVLRFTDRQIAERSLEVIATLARALAQDPHAV